MLNVKSFTGRSRTLHFLDNTFYVPIHLLRKVQYNTIQYSELMDSIKVFEAYLRVLEL